LKKRTKKPLLLKRVAQIKPGPLYPKVFCFFFSKKKALLPCLVYRCDISNKDGRSRALGIDGNAGKPLRAPKTLVAF
jgi:hypothetical protein